MLYVKHQTYKAGINIKHFDLVGRSFYLNSDIHTLLFKVFKVAR